MEFDLKDLILEAVQTFPGWFRAYVVPPLAVAVGITVALVVIGVAFNRKGEQEGPWFL